MIKFEEITKDHLLEVNFNTDLFAAFKYAYLLHIDDYNEFTDSEKKVIEMVIKKEYYLYYKYYMDKTL